MNDELITRLRDEGDGLGYAAVPCDLLAEAADALGAARAEADGLHAALNAMLTEWDALLAERDAEAALADRAVRCLEEWVAWSDGADELDTTEDEAVLAAHRERRTTPTKDGER